MTKKKHTSHQWSHVTTPSVECHYGNVHAFDIFYGGKKIEFWAGGWTRGVMPSREFVVIDLAGNVQPDDGISVYGEGLEALANYRPYRTLVDLEIVDYQAPEYGRDLWELLVSELSKLSDPIKVLVMCMGGHGRTGTVLSVIWGLFGGQTGDPVRYVREHYCHKAVETAQQLDYVEKITGLQVTSLPVRESFNKYKKGHDKKALKEDDLQHFDDVYLPAFRYHEDDEVPF